MVLQSIGEILQTIEAAHARLLDVVGDVSDAQAEVRPSEDSWTIAEIVEHLANVQEGMGKVTSIILKKVEGEGAKAEASDRIRPLDFDALSERLAQKFQAPENVRPKGGVSVEASLARIANDYERISGMRERLEAADLSAASFPHPAIGPIDGYHWLALIGLHEERHIAQIKRIKEAIKM